MADADELGIEGQVICPTPLSACQELIKGMPDEERKIVVKTVFDLLPENDLMNMASTLFESILEKRDPKLVGYMPKDFIEKAIISTHTFFLNNIETNVLYHLVQAVSCSQFNTQHLPVDSLPFSAISAILSSLFGTGAEEFHLSPNGRKLALWLETNCHDENADAFLHQINKLFFPWDHVQYKVSGTQEQSKVMLNIYGEYKSTFEQNEELGCVFENMVLEPVEKEIELCTFTQHNQFIPTDYDDIDEDEDDEDENHILESSTNNMADSLLQAIEVPYPATSQEIETIVSESSIKTENKQSDIKKEPERTEIPFACHLCTEQFPGKTSLLSHMNEVHYLQEDGNFQCPECGDLFTVHDEMRIHEVSHTFQCEECEKMFSRKAELDKHLVLHEAVDTPCVVCYENFPSKAAMVLHRVKEHDKNTVVFKCDHCPREFPQMRNLRYHINTVHPDKPQAYTCEQCMKSFLLPENLRRHNERVHGVRQKFKCDVCPRSFKKNLALQYHKKRAHSIDSGQLLKCPQCEKSFGTKVALIKHKALHYKDRSYPCPICSRIFTKRQIMRDHHKREHPDSQITFKCSVCDAEFPNLSRKMKHEKTEHQLKKSFACTLCPSKFGDPYALERHVNIHSGTKNFKCDTCGKKFYTARHLQRHIAHIHDGKPTRKTKPERVACDQCEKTFVEKRYLVRHQQREHLGRTEYDEVTCPICTQTFSGMSSLKRHHRRIHKGLKDHTSKDFQCDQCAKTFTFKQSLQRHMQSAHQMLLSQYQCDVCRKYFAKPWNLRKHQEHNNACKPRRKRDKLTTYNVQQIAQPRSTTTTIQDTKPQFVEIHVMDIQSPNSNNITYHQSGDNNMVTTTTIPAGATWNVIQQQQQPQIQQQQQQRLGQGGQLQITQGQIIHDEVTGHVTQGHIGQDDEVTEYQFTTAPVNSEQSGAASLIQQIEAVEEGGVEGIEGMEGIEGAEIINDGQHILIQDAETQEWTEISRDNLDQLTLQGGVLEVPFGVQFVRLGEKILRVENVDGV